MTRFVDEYLDNQVPGYPCVSSPRWSTEIVQVDSGRESVNQRWAHPLMKFTLPEAVRDMSIFNAVRDHWLVMRGPVYTWPWRDPLDFASVSLAIPNEVPVITGTDQVIGTGDGVTTSFQLTKTYAVGTQTYSRKITLPILDTVIVTIDNVVIDESEYTVSRPGGVITFDSTSTPAVGEVVRAGFLFDVEVRFEDDLSFDGIVQAFGLGGFADITLIETRSC